MEGRQIIIQKKRKTNMTTNIDNISFSELWQSILIKATDLYSVPPQVITIGGSTISTLGNFSASTGKGKSKKTFNVSAIVASAISGRRVLGYDAHFPQGKRKVLYFDTEQSSYHCHRVLERILILSGLSPEKDHDSIEFVMLREFSPVERREIIARALEHHPDVGLVVIDGLRDLLFDINSSTEAAEVIGLLMKWTAQYNLHIHTVLHLNKADDNVRGHIGTELNNKAETILQITRNESDPSVSEVRASLIRDREFLPFAFRINSDGLPELATDIDFRKKTQTRAFCYENLSEEVHRKALDLAFHDISRPIQYSLTLEQLGLGYASIGFDRSRGIRVKLLQFLMKNDIIRKQDKGYVYNRDFVYKQATH